MKSKELLLHLALACLLTIGWRQGGQVAAISNPPLTTVGGFRPVISNSVCGMNGQEEYCIFTPDEAASLAPNCMRAQCNNTCPFSSSSPIPLDLVSQAGSFTGDVSATVGMPGSAGSAVLFEGGSISVNTPSVPLISSNGFSFTTWINQDDDNNGVLISKVLNSRGLNYAVAVNATSVTLQYLIVGASDVTFLTISSLQLDQKYWQHISVTVFAEDVAFYVNGSLVGASSLERPILDELNGDIKLGVAREGTTYLGLMQDVNYYSRALTAREVVEVANGSLPFLHLTSQCRCPPSHPSIFNDDTCSQHPMATISRGIVSRLNSFSKPVGYVNDQTSRNWVSSPGISNVQITINLTQSLYELFLINVRYNSPRPRAAVLESSRDGGHTFQAIQYYADNCMQYFNMTENEPLSLTNLVNCISSESSQSPTFDASVQFRFVNPQFRSYDLAAPAAREFMTASHLRLRLVDFFTESTFLQHRYFSIQEIAIVARCACNGHGSVCGSRIDSTCQCLDHTQGPTCNACLPTHNDKAWRAATADNSFACKPCRCNNHSSACIYNASVDPFPDRYDMGGGGVCEDCDSFTAGVNCETCQFGYYRPSDRSPDDPSPCVSCDCDPNGIRDQGDCVKTSGSGGQIIGQCFCKTNVIGLRCQQCRSGFANLARENPDGCEPCTCNPAGTFNGQDTCDSSDGQCFCKRNVMGARCDVCRPNTTMLSAANMNGCSPCQCDSRGSASDDCDSVSGACTCLPGVTGLRCDQCLPSFTGISSGVCVRCSCDPSGSHNNSCDPDSAQCPCRPNFVGTTCDTCDAGFYRVAGSCQACNCFAAGTVAGSTTDCSSTSGQCQCKANVEGRRCDVCRSGFTTLLASNQDGCSPCDCFSPNTNFTGQTCHPITAQCECIAMAMGRRCDQCLLGSYLTSAGCVSCDCDVGGALSSSCGRSGECSCSVGVAGRRCDTCVPGFFNFPSCTSCGCNSAGTLPGGGCDLINGTCFCKAFVRGGQCSECVAGYVNLEALNPLGCSAVPDELAPPTVTVLSSSSILLSWRPPEVPMDGFIQGYNVFIDNTLIATVTGLNYTRVGLSPTTQYQFFIEAFNSAGSTRSDPVTGTTLEGMPSGQGPPVLVATSAMEVSASWATPTTPNGAITRYELVQVTLGPELVVLSEEVVFSGMRRNTMVTGLLPFTDYFFIVRACTSGGCGSSPPATVRTLQAPPSFQPMPNVSTLSSNSLFLEWEVPSEPNGVISHYEVRQREVPFQGVGVVIANTSVDTDTLVVEGLMAFTEYQFSVQSFTGGGGTLSLWTSGITGEDSPGGVLPPVLVALSPSEILVTWQLPSSPNGVILVYRVFQEGTAITSSPDTGSFTSAGLQPFTRYQFHLEACTSAGCGTSPASFITTLEAAPQNQPPPSITNITATSLSLSWATPTSPNGIISSYSVLRRTPSLLPSPLPRDVGVAFDGNIIRRFQGSDHDLGGARNSISLSFRTLSDSGTLLYYINDPGTDFMAIELRNSTPTFLFDAGSGPAVIRPDVAGGMRFDDGLWHAVSVSHNRREGSITVDGMYSGTGQSMGLDEVVTSNQVLYVGGIPDSLPRSTVAGLSSPDSTLSGRSLAGCVFDVSINGRALDFATATTVGEVISELPGCPVDLERGFSYLGGGYLSILAGTLSAPRFSWTVEYRTTHSDGLLFFIHNTNGTALGIEIQNSSLHLVLLEGGVVQRQLVAGEESCSGQWSSLLIDQSFNEIFVGVNGSGRSLFLSSSATTFSSTVYFGGVPSNTTARNLAMDAGLNVNFPFSGCIRNSFPGLITNGVPVAQVQLAGSRMVRFDGCYVGGASSICHSSVTSVAAATNQMIVDAGLQPFSVYLYAVRANTSAGSATSVWRSVTTSQTVPAGVGVVSLVASTSSSLTLSWERPTIPNGLVSSYNLVLTPTATVGLAMAAGNVSTATLDVGIPEMVLLTVARALSPATTYSVVLSASTVAGATGTGGRVELTTAESVPEGVASPMMIGVGSRELTISWQPPSRPNGVINEYNLLVGGVILSTVAGSSNSTLLAGLQPFTEYSLLLQACTRVGCTNSSMLVTQTLPDAPSGLAPPTLSVLSPSSISASWRLPNNTNGVISRIELRRLTTPTDFMVEFVDSNLTLATTVTGLLPNTNYSFQVVAFNAGGSVASEVSIATTLEDIPDQISPPVAMEIGPTHLLVSWVPPAVPNGEVILYNLTLDGRVIFSLMNGDLSYNVTRLRPFTTYSLAIIACTTRGCGSSIQSTFTTLEAMPQGYVQPVVTAVTPTTITLEIQSVASPNGQVLYIIRNIDGVGVAGVVFNSSSPAQVTVAGLQPFTNYSFELEVVNSAGSLAGPPFTIATVPTVPEGQASPVLSLLNATSVLVQWAPPTSPNGVILTFALVVSSPASTVTLDQGLTTSAVLANLSPFTFYQISVLVTNTEGSIVSDFSNITTGETAPSGFDRVVVLAQGSRHIHLSWDPPANSNGILVNYTIIQDCVVVAATLPTSQSYNVTDLQPFTSYNFSVMVCTSAACATSQQLLTSTLEDVPEGVSAPFVSGGSRGLPVIIVVIPPSRPNGVISQYTVERRDSMNITIIGMLPGNATPLTVVDFSTQPFTTYSYRVLAENIAGVAVSQFTIFLTPEAAPQGVMAPALIALTSTSVMVTFHPPTSPRGNITMYTISRFASSSSSPDTPTSVFTYTPSTLTLLSNNGDPPYTFNDTNLRPFTNYSYVLTVCNSADCTDGEPGHVLTLEDTPMGVLAPFLRVDSSSVITVSWVEPSMPNGMITSYVLLRLSHGFGRVSEDCCSAYLVGSFRLPGECGLVGVFGANVSMVEDGGLMQFSFYQYCLIVSNSADSAASEPSEVVRTSPAPMPVRGPPINASTLSSTVVLVEWGHVEEEELLGPFSGYELYVRELSMPGLGQVVFRGSDQFFMADNLQPNTEYVFTVSVSNGVGVAFSENVSATTEDGIPANLTAPVVEAVGSDVLRLTLREPLQPNGDIILYNVFLDGRLVQNATVMGDVLLEGLRPFTQYMVMVEACTRFGCTASPLVTSQTLEAAPDRLASPFVSTVDPTSINISWSAPQFPNGIILEYRVLQTTPTDPTPTVVFSGLSFTSLVSGLRPFTVYQFRILARNSVGNVTSIPTTNTTLPAPPTSIAPPTVSIRSSSEILVRWSAPEEVNGLLVGYQLYKDGVPVFTTFTTSLSYLDSDLQPFTSYQYMVEVCSSGGCVNSSSITNVTLEALPEMVNDPIVVGVTPRSLELVWTGPGSPNGLIREYVLTQVFPSLMEVFRGPDVFSFIAADLQPFTSYAYQLMVCNSAGCVTSNVVENQTLETSPEQLDSPRLRNLTSTSVAIEWTPPRIENGPIRTYILRRGNDSFPDMPEVIFQGLNLSYNDGNLVADTLYSYTVTAVNGGGSITSNQSFFQTVPDLAEGILPPSLTVLGSRSIRAQWSPPDMPNGDISTYRLLVNNDIVFSGLNFSYEVMNLLPFTRYAFFLEVCNQAGCASSTTVSVTTDQALPEGVAPPILTVMGARIINVEWALPNRSNGVISQYQVQRRIPGNIFSLSIQHVGGPETLSFLNSGLMPFTLYEYRLRVTNGAGSVFSEWMSAQTIQDTPSGLSVPMFADVRARNVTASWSPPTSPNGPITGYLLEYRLPIDPVTFGPGEVQVGVALPPNITLATITGLTPVTSYEVRVVAINGAGRGESLFELVTTAEDVPEGVQEVIVDQRTSSSLVLSWNQPTSPHGVIQEFMLYLDGALVFRGIPPASLAGLVPFTTYNLQLAACTSAGCGLGILQSVTTAETAPLGQNEPSLVVLTDQQGGGAVEVSWDVPLQPNGRILEYQVLRRETGIVSIVNITNNVLVRRFVDRDVLPARSYSYAIRVVNSVGQTDSDFSNITTPEAAPEMVTPPVLTPLSSFAIQVSWLPPTRPNGVIVSYELLRSSDESANMSVFSHPSDRGFTDTGLQPFTEYSYTLQACTAAGCSFSFPTVARTLEATPTGFIMPVVSALSFSSISLMWEMPSNPNGVISRYSITISPSGISLVISGTETQLTRNITGLLPFTNYTVTVEACNSAGCVSNSSDVLTLEHTPQVAPPPGVTVVNATALSIMWVEPDPPNGVIVRYELRRNGMSVFNGTQTSFIDSSLLPRVSYSYTIQSFTQVGGSDISRSSDDVTTPSDTPQGVMPPSLLATGPQSVFANWSEPSAPNGVIQRYVLIQNGSEVHEQLGFQLAVIGLLPFTTYSYQLMACTSTCNTSMSAIITTLEAAPEDLAPPTLVETTPLSVLVSWSPPVTPHGIIMSYRVLRRQEAQGSIVVFEGSSLSYQDEGVALQPDTSYKYRISAANSAGNITSNVTRIRLAEAPPSDVPLPLLENITATSVDVLAQVPSMPNGVIVAYRLIVNGTLSQTIVPPADTFAVSGLSPFTQYEFVIEACTAPGCNASEGVVTRTGEALPASLAPPTGRVLLDQNSIEVSWQPVAQPNGIILSYSLWYRTACPQAPQPNRLTQPDCALGPTLLAADSLSPDTRSFLLSSPAQLSHYTSYEFQVGVVNSIGSINSTFQEPDIVTVTSSPIAVREISLLFSNGVVSLDWSLTFQLNGVLFHYDLRRNGVLLSRSLATSVTLAQEPLDQALLEYEVTVVTGVGEATQRSPLRVSSESPSTSSSSSSSTSSTTDFNVTASTPTEQPFYEEPPFIVGMVILAILLLFLCLATLLCCIKPRGNKTPLEKSQLAQTPPLSPGHTSKSSPKRAPVTASWSPNDNTLTKGEIPDMDESEVPYLNPEAFSTRAPVSRELQSYSPMQMGTLTSNRSRLSDIVIANSHSDAQVKAAENFTRKHQQTFEDSFV